MYVCVPCALPHAATQCPRTEFGGLVAPEVRDTCALLQRPMHKMKSFDTASQQPCLPACQGLGLRMARAESTCRLALALIPPPGAIFQLQPCRSKTCAKRVRVQCPELTLLTYMYMAAKTASAAICIVHCLALARHLGQQSFTMPLPEPRLITYSSSRYI